MVAKRKRQSKKVFEHETAEKEKREEEVGSEYASTRDNPNVQGEEEEDYFYELDFEEVGDEE